ncbi:10 kDa heat shock protein, mitochondrial-like [Sycon ciliatum]|uniref:10 kDa heat shock protein, mitochondrial-like n=1 Tax=Sycon ciliatum TaxID=27933 RepID=UPI0020ADD467|eukprot:scpid57142/ scgid19143/ 10 kDa heat shock protein, mitochondrial; 10 kDa chaperonin; Chaperonin 10
MSALKRFAPLFDRVLVQRLNAESTTKGGILIPEKAQGKVHEGVVRAVGPGALRDDGSRAPMSVNAGDHVYLPEYGGTKVTLEEEEFTLFRDADLLAKIAD